MSPRIWHSALVPVAALLSLAGVETVAPRAAEAQARGTLQVAAVVVNTAPALEAIQATKAAFQQPRGWNSQHSNSVATLATVRVISPSTDADRVVVTVEYTRN